MSLTRIAATEIKPLLKTIPNWKFIPNMNSSSDALVRVYKFKSFEDTWSFLTKVAMRSHKYSHHVKIINLYNIVELELTTHDVGGLSELDFKMAKAFEKSAQNFGLKD